MDFLASLPIELVLEILQHAAFSSVHERRRWAVDVALVGRNVYHLVKDVLYSTMVITTANIQRVHEASLDASCLHVFRAVRRLVITLDAITFYSGERDDSALGRRTLWEASHFARLFSSAKDLDIPVNALRVLSTSSAFQPSRLAIRYSTFSSIDKGLNSIQDSHNDAGPDAFRSVTHLCGFLPLLPESVHTLLAAAPALTHLAFDFTRLLPPGPYHVARLPSPDATRVEIALRAALQHSHLRAVALVGDATVLLEVARRVCDPRIMVWSQGRLTDSCTSADEECEAVQNAWAGQDVWTEARNV